MYLMTHNYQPECILNADANIITSDSQLGKHGALHIGFLKRDAAI